MGIGSLRIIALAAILLAGPAMAQDDIGDFLEQAEADTSIPEPENQPDPLAGEASCSEGIVPKRAGKFCDNVDDCMKYCSCACSFDPHKWRNDVRDDGSTTCPDLPESGVGMLAPDSDLLSTVPDLPYLTIRRGTTATADAIEGLRRLSDHLADPANANRVNYGYTVKVLNCYRPHTRDTTRECGFVLKAKHKLAQDLDETARKHWLKKANPNNLGLSWPGRTPHSGGYACDLVLLDSSGRESFDWRAGVPGTPNSSIKQRTASALMDEEATGPDVGALRLRYEAWHYEWGPNASGCRHPDCAANYWPLTGSP